MDGLLVLDKAPGITSHDAVVAVRRLLRERRIGHLGTLDPFSTGVLVLLVGRATRLAPFFRDREKVYQGTIRFGYSTDTYDCTGVPTSPEQVPELDVEHLRSLFQEFVGTYGQEPPPFSAKKIGGVPAYRLARQGQAPKLAPVQITIHELELLSVEGPFVKFHTRVSSGAYVRALAHQLGGRMGLGGHLHQLRRIAVGEFDESRAVSLEQLEQRFRQPEPVLIPPEDLLPEFPTFTLSGNAVRLASNGQSVHVPCPAPWVRLLDPSGKLLAMARRVAGYLFRPIIVFGAG